MVNEIVRIGLSRGGKKPKLFLYGVTSSYLEGEQNYFGAHGYNRDGNNQATDRSAGKQRILQLGLFETELCEVKDDGVRYVLRRNPARAEEKKIPIISRHPSWFCFFD